VKVVFVSMDTVRSDRLGVLGGTRSLTPNLDRIAAEGALFTQAFASDIPTQPSHTALFTGRFGVSTSIVSHFHPGSQLADDAPWLPSLFQSHGYRTGAIDHLFAMKDWFIRGYDDYMPPPGRSRSPGSVINDIAFPWLDANAAHDFYLLLHFWDAHIPYVPPSPFKERFTAVSSSWRDPLIENHLRSRPSYALFKRNLYDHLGDIPNLDYIADLHDAEVAYLDFELGRLFEYLGRLGGLDDTMVVLFGDHGENMTEHDSWFDHAGLYDSVVHVPLIIWAPGLVAPARISSMVSLVDVMPTVLELLEFPAAGEMDGRSLVPLMLGDTDAHRTSIVLSECTWQAKRGIRTKKWKYIRCYDPGIYPRDGDELYDLDDDPAEQCNVAELRPDVTAELGDELDRWLAEHLKDGHDPMRDVTDVGLPAVARLADVIREDTERSLVQTHSLPLSGHSELSPAGAVADLPKDVVGPGIMTEEMETR
jgi:arylsulfatase